LQNITEPTTTTLETVPTCNNTSVGIIVLRHNDILLIERKKYPAGLACPAGHVEESELKDGEESFADGFLTAAYRELREETGLNASSMRLVNQGKRFNPCRRSGGTWHEWKVFVAQVYENQSYLLNEQECKRIDWYTPEYVRHLALRTELYLAQQISQEEWNAFPGLEPVWYYWLRSLKMLQG
jgi:ADP-ribose pyrophosphatase YjhB (NUDIX family)